MSPPLEAFRRATSAISPRVRARCPFICFDLAGGANLNNSEMLLGAGGNPLNFLSTQGYATLGLPGNMTPSSANAASATNNFINTEFGAAWHSDGAILRGMQASTQAATRANTNGFPHRGALGKRHRQQSAQPDVRHQPHRRRRRAADADRFAEHRFGRQLDGARGA